MDKRKLVLKKETLRLLQERQLKQVVGGRAETLTGCAATNRVTECLPSFNCTPVIW